MTTLPTSPPRALTPGVRDTLFTWLDAQSDAGARPNWNTAVHLAARFDLDLGTARRVVTAWMLVHAATEGGDHE